MHLSDVEIRVLGSLLEKQRTTPDAYPLSLNALRLACNQATNRDPVVDYDEAQIREALTRLGRARYTRLTSTQGSRAAKFRHLIDETLGVGAPEQAILAVLMLRGPQTPGELRQRTERLHAFADSEALGAALRTLIDRGLAERLERRPGQKEERYAHRLGAAGGDGGASAATGGPLAAGGALAAAHDDGTPAQTRAAPVSAPSAAGSPAPGSDAAPAAPDPAMAGSGDDAARLDRLERRVGELAAELAMLRRELGIDPPAHAGD